MPTTKRRRAMGSDPLADAAPGSIASEDAPSAAAPAPESSPEPSSEERIDPPPAEALPPLDQHVPPAPPLRPVPRLGALDPKDRVRTLTVALLMALGLALYAQHLNQLSEIEEAFILAQGRANVGDEALDAARARSARLETVVAMQGRQLEHNKLLLAESEAEGRGLGAALTELSRATASAAQAGELAAALSAVSRDLAFAQRWPRERWAKLLYDFERGDSLRIGRPARPEELAALRGEVRGTTLQALADASDGLRPWRALGPDDRLDPYPVIAERGLLLLVLLEAGMTVPDLTVIPFESAGLRGQRLGRADLGGVDLNRADLRGADLSATTLLGTNLTGAVYDAATRWPPGFDPAAAGATREATPAP